MALFKSLFAHDKKLTPLWTYDAHGTLLAGITAVAIGSARAIFLGTKDGRVLCLDEQGRERWSFSTQEDLGATTSWFVDESRVYAIDAPPVVADVDMDGKPEIIATSEQGTVYCISAAGKLKWKHECGGDIKSSACVADCNGDGHPEVLVCSGNNKLTALTGKGEQLFEYIANAPLHSSPAVLQLPKSRSALILFGDDAGTLTAIKPSQDVAWRVHLNAPITAAPAFFSHPEEERIVIGTQSGAVVCVSEHGELVWEYKTGGSVYGTATLADLDGDGHLEIVVGSCDNAVHAITREGKRLWSYMTDFWITMSPLTADLDGDGQQEVIAGSYDRTLYILDGPGEYQMDYVPGIAGILNQAGHYGSLLTSEVGEQAGKLRWSVQLPDMVVGGTLLPLKDGTGILVAAKNGAVTLFALRDA